MAMAGGSRIVIANENIPNMVGQITTILADEKINISEMLNRHLGEYAYNIIDIEGSVSDETVEKLKQIKGVVMARAVNGA
jgi:D-3-phosphoglycerate dehydrogenase